MEESIATLMGNYVKFWSMGSDMGGKLQGLQIQAVGTTGNKYRMNLLRAFAVTVLLIKRHF